jgi:replicative DNA helicase
VVLFIFREDVYKRTGEDEGGEPSGRTELIVGKQRNGPTGNVPVVFIKRYARFENLSREHASEG